MHSLNLPAGASILLTATARPKVGVHRWGVRVLTSATCTPRMTFGSDIGGRDCEQRIDIPAQTADCRVEIWAGRPAVGGWNNDRSVITNDTPSRLQIGFSHRGASRTQEPDVLLNFAFGGADRSL
jgi:hypothetical protein